MNSSELLDNFLKGDKRALARIITHVDNRSNMGTEIMNKLYGKAGNSHIIGFTGPPGAGKSTLVSAVIREFRKRGNTIAVIAVDPTSPYSRGALLGDRVRMLEFTDDPRVFIRSMASRGKVGGLSSSTYDTMTVLDVFGFDIIIIETVGAGQAEIDIVQTCDTTVVLAVPGLGDDIQILKAGIMEIADIFAVNKSDKVGAKELSILIKNMLISNDSKWQVPVCLTSAINNTGIEEFVNTLNDHWEYIKKKKNILHDNRLQNEIINRYTNSIKKIIISSSILNNCSKLIRSGEITFTDALNLITKQLQS